MKEVILIQINEKNILLQKIKNHFCHLLVYQLQLPLLIYLQHVIQLQHLPFFHLQYQTVKVNPLMRHLRETEYYSYMLK